MVEQGPYLVSYNSNSFSLRIHVERRRTTLDMQLHTTFVDTYSLPNTLSFLEKHFPNVLGTQCFNDKNLSFREEVQQTEIGHLFEHILLEYLCLEKLAGGHCKAVFNGRTNWNWLCNPHGFFSIVIDAGISDSGFLATALKKSILLTELLLNEGMNTFENEDLLNLRPLPLLVEGT